MEILNTCDLSSDQAKKLVHDILLTQTPESRDAILEMIKQTFMDKNAD